MNRGILHLAGAPDVAFLNLVFQQCLTGGVDDARKVGDVHVLTRVVTDLDKAALRDLADSLKGKLGKAVVILGSAGDGKVSFVVSVTKDVTDRVHAGKLVKQLAPIVGGGGGGRSDFAEAGGKQPEKLADLLATGRSLVEQLLTG